MSGLSIRKAVEAVASELRRSGYGRDEVGGIAILKGSVMVGTSQRQ
jgi:hypothetical protein